MPRLVEDLTGREFGRLTVIGRSPEVPNGRRDSSAYYRCRCECGGQVDVRAANLRRGVTKSCGCLQAEVRKANAEARFVDLTGQTIGRLTVLAREFQEPETFKSHWRCVCVCGNETVVEGSSLRKGSTKSCGCLQAENRAAYSPQLGRRHPWQKKYEIGDSTCR